MMELHQCTSTIADLRSFSDFDFHRFFTVRMAVYTDTIAEFHWTRSAVGARLSLLLRAKIVVFSFLCVFSREMLFGARYHCRALVYLRIRSCIVNLRRLE